VERFGALQPIRFIFMPPERSRRFFLLSDQARRAPPVAASLEGQYIFKSLVAAGAALVIDVSGSDANNFQ
jgi:hypothetical protein